MTSPTKDLTISEMLTAAGYGHRRNERSVSTGRHEIYRLSDGTHIGNMTAGEAVDFLAGAKVPA